MELESISSTDTLYKSDTVMIPKDVKVGDTIRLDDTYTQEPIMINYYWFPTGPGVGYSKRFSIWYKANNGFYYIAFRQKNRQF